MTRLYLSVGVIALAAMIGWPLYKAGQFAASDPFAACRDAAVAGGTIGGAFTLTDQFGKTVTDAQVFAKPALVYFGYTSCPDVCPLDNGRNVEAADLLAKQGYAVTPVFITVDPTRDTPAALTEYTANFGPNLLGLTGTPDQIAGAAKAFRAYYKLPEARTGNYEVDHSTFTYLMLPKIGFATFFERDTKAQAMADRTLCFVKASPPST